MTDKIKNSRGLADVFPVLLKKLCMLHGCSVRRLLVSLVVAEAKRYGLIEARGVEL